MTKYRKKPVVIDAIQWDGTKEQGAAIAQRLAPDGSIEVYTDFNAQLELVPRLTCRTLEGYLLASPGDYIIRGIGGEVYPCTPGIFEASYEAVPE